MGELKQGSDPHIRAIVWIRRETFKAESETADLWQSKWNENQTVLAAVIHTPDRDLDPLEDAAAGNWSLEIVEQSQGEGCCWLWRDRSRGCEGGDFGGKCLWRKARQPWKQGDTAESCVGGGAITIVSLHLHSWTVERLAHQTPDAMSYRVGPHQGAPLSAWHADLQSRTPARGPFYVIDVLKNREGLQTKEPSKCLNRQSYGERLAKEAFWLPATRGWKIRHW